LPLFSCFPHNDGEKSLKFSLNRQNLIGQSIIRDLLFIRRLLILQFLRHAEFISASLQLKEILKQVQDDEVILRSL